MRGSPLLTLLRRRSSFLTLWLVVTLTLQPAALFHAEAPEWWTTRGVLIPGAAPDDHAVLNQGQLKHLATAAVAEMDATLTGGAGPVLTSMVSSWQNAGVTAENYAAVTLGQIKAVASKFYTRMGLPYPWADSPDAPDDYALANLGQAKALFAFDLDPQFIDITTDPAWPLLQDVLNDTLAGELTSAEYTAVIALVNQLKDAGFVSALQAAMARSTPPAGAAAIAAVLEQASTTTGAETLALAQPLGPGEDGMMLVRTGKYYGAHHLTNWGPLHQVVTDGGVNRGFPGGHWSENVFAVPSAWISTEGDHCELIRTVYASTPYSPKSFEGIPSPAVKVRTNEHPMELFSAMRAWSYGGQQREHQGGESTQLEVDDPEEPHAARHSATRTYLIVEKRWTNPLVILENGIAWPSSYGAVETVGVGSVTFTRTRTEFAPYFFNNEAHLEVGTLSPGVAAPVPGNPAAVTVTCPVPSAVTDMTEKVSMVTLLPIEVRTYDWYWKHSGASDNPSDYYRTFTATSSDPTGNRTKKTDELKIAQWYSVIDNGVFKPNEIAQDPDAFFIRVPGLSAPSSGSNAYRAKVWTDQDAGAEVELTPVTGQSGVYQSKGLCLVSNDADDSQPTASGADGSLDDQTFKIELGSKVKIKFLFGSTASGSAPDMELPVPVKKTLRVAGYILKEGNITPTEVTPLPNANACLDTARRLLAQVGVKLDGGVSVVASNPAGVEFGGLFGIAGDFDNPDMVGASVATPPESTDLFSALSPPQKDAIFYFVSDCATGGFKGITTVPKAMPPGTAAYHNRIVIDAKQMTEDTLAHEFLHVLLNGVHSVPYNDFIFEFNNHGKNLWYGGPAVRLGGGGNIFIRTRINDPMLYRIQPPASP